MSTVLGFALAFFLSSGEESLVVKPMYRGEKPPTVRSARHILLRYQGALEASAHRERSREEAVEIARSLVARVRAGFEFEKLAVEHSQDPDAAQGAVLGTFPSGMLAPALDEFLFSADLGAVSHPIVDDRGVHVLQRIESHAAVLQILIRGREPDARVRCSEIASRLREGADFAKLAGELSADRESAARGGQFAIYERGVDDKLLKAAAFRMDVGDVSAPIETPLGLHFLKRVPLDEVDPSLAEPTFVHLRGILLRFDERFDDGRGRAHARDLADQLYERLRRGEDMRKIARELDEDPGGKEREGDLGWVFRNQPGLPREVKRACLLRIGELSEPTLTAVGYLILRREK